MATVCMVAASLEMLLYYDGAGALAAALAAGVLMHLGAATAAVVGNFVVCFYGRPANTLLGLNCCRTCYIMLGEILIDNICQINLRKSISNAIIYFLRSIQKSAILYSVSIW